MSTTASKSHAKRNQWPKVRHLEGRPKPWRVDARINGKGERLFFASAIEADGKADLLRIERRNTGSAGVAVPEKLRVEATDCAQRLASVGATITEATAYFLRHARPSGGTRTLAEVIAQFLKAKQQAGRKPEYIRIQGHILNHFARTFGERVVHGITDVDVSGWMQEQPWKLRTRENYRRDLSCLFSFAVKHGYSATNPLLKLERATLDDVAPGILTPSQAASLLTTAESIEGGELLPYAAIGLFAGLRSSELAALDWREVSIAERTIEVTAAKAKTRARRIVTMTDNLALWLETHAKPSGPIVPADSFAPKWRRVRAASQIKPWPKNAMRHSFASYHVAAHKNAPLTSLEMGHDNPAQLFAAYRELVKPKEATAFWQIKPAADGKVVAMVAA